MPARKLSDLFDDQDRGFRLQGKWGTPGAYQHFDWPATRAALAEGVAKLRQEIEQQYVEWNKNPALKFGMPQEWEYGFVDGEVSLVGPKVPGWGTGGSGPTYATFSLENRDELHATRWELSLSVLHHDGDRIHELSREQVAWMLRLLFATYLATYLATPM